MPRGKALHILPTDPELVGYMFIDQNIGTLIEFLDEREAEVSIVGIPFRAPYDASGENVVIRGPNGIMSLTRKGDTLFGMGMALRRKQPGQ